METLFENKYTRNKELAKKLYGYIFFKRKQAMIANICMIFIIVLYTVAYAFFKTSLYLWCSLFIGVLFIFFKVFAYFISIKNLIKRDAETNGGNPLEISINVTDKYIEHSTSSGSVGKLEYGSIKSIKKTKDMIFIMSKAKLIFVLPVYTFTLGNADDFVKFIRGKIKK